MRVLLTGFGPFPGAPFNPSAALAKALARRRRPALVGDRTRGARVRNDLRFRRSRTAKAARAKTRHRADVRRRRATGSQLCIETQARNAVSLLFPDASGHRPLRGVIKLRRTGGTRRQRAIRAPCRRGRNERHGCRAMPAAICATMFTGAAWNRCAAPGRWCNSFISRRSAPSRSRGAAAKRPPTLAPTSESRRSDPHRAHRRKPPLTVNAGTSRVPH